MPDSDYILVRIVPDGSNKLKVTWGNGGLDFHPYSIDQDLLIRKANDVRTELQNLAHEVVRRGSERCGVVLKTLAQAGSNLGKALFTSNPRSHNPATVRTWLKNRQGRDKILFVIDERIQIPWGLIYDGNADEISGKPNDSGIHNFYSFWNLKYSIASVYNRITPEALDEAEGPGTTLIRVVDPSALQRAMTSLNNAEKNRAERLFELFRYTFSTKSDFFQKWDVMLEHSTILFFFCHASGTQLSLGESEKITIDDLLLQASPYGDTTTKATTLVLINGCSTAIGDPGGGFLEATGNAPFYGFVGTEADIPDAFALRFGQALLQNLISSGEHIYKIIDRMRKRHWPLSLLYSLYCHPNYTVSWHGEDLIDIDPVEDNFSSLNHGKTFLRVEVSCES
jgi:hypothetical protein